MGVHMEFQIGHLVKGSITLVASERLFSRVNHDVITQITLLVKALAADVADEGLLVTMRSQMRFEGGRPVKAFPTFVTFMRFFLGVDDLMPAEGTR